MKGHENHPDNFTADWHNHGANHQANNNPGDTAADRHNFGNAAAGKSGHNPTAGSNQDDFSEVAGLPLIPVDEDEFLDEELMAEQTEDELDMLF